MLPIDRITISTVHATEVTPLRFPGFHRFQTEILPCRRHRRGEEHEVGTSPAASKIKLHDFPV
jgi:hypothetical protein